MQRLKIWFAKNPDITFLLFIIIFSSWVLSSVFLMADIAYWDNPKFFSIFRDHLHSLNKFGEIAWWFPQNQFGWPGYYYSILGDSSVGSPIFASIGFIVFLLGKFGIIIDTYFQIYTFYYSILTPALFLIASYYVIKILFKSKYTRIYALSIAAFSPAVIFNLSDIGFLEPLVWFLFFFGTFLRLLAKREKKQFLLFVLSLQLLALTFNFTSLFWNILFVPVVIFIFIFYPRDQIQANLSKIKSIPLGFWIAGIIAALICITPNLITFSQAGDLVRSRMGAKFYTLFDLMSGNPIESFTISLPYFGFEWTNGSWAMRYANQHISFNYMGLICLPFALFGLIKSKQVVFRRLLLCIILGFLVFNLSSMSPVFSALLALPTPLKGNNHFGDAFFRAGGFLIMLISAVQGFNLWQMRPQSNLFRALFSVCFFTNLLVYFMAFGLDVFGQLSFGIYFAIGIFLLILILRCKANSNFVYIFNFILILNLLDVSTITYSYIRTQMLRNANKVMVESENQNGLGLSDRYINDYADSILMYQPFFDMKKMGFKLEVLPQFGLYSKAHKNSDMQNEISTVINNPMKGSEPSIHIGSDFAEVAPFNNFLNSTATEKPNGMVTISEQTYQSLKLDVKTDREALLFIKDAFSPYWQAEVNGKEVPIARSLFNFKVLPVMKGESQVVLSFKPPFIAVFFVLAYLSIFINLGLIYRESKKPLLQIRRKKVN